MLIVIIVFLCLQGQVFWNPSSDERIMKPVVIRVWPSSGSHRGVKHFCICTCKRLFKSWFFVPVKRCFPIYFLTEHPFQSYQVMTKNSSDSTVSQKTLQCRHDLFKTKKFNQDKSLKASSLNTKMFWAMYLGSNWTRIMKNTVNIFM